MADEITTATAVKAPKKKEATVDTVAAVSFTFSPFGKAKGDAMSTTVPMKNVSIEKNFNPRKKMSGVEELAANVKVSGLLHPITVRPYPKGEKPGQYRVVAGERRFRAVTSLGWDSVPVVIRPDLADDDILALTVAGSENGDDSTRVPLTHAERSDMYKKYADAGWTVKRIAKELNANDREVRRCLDMQEWPEDVRAAYDKGKLNFTTALEVAKYPDETRAAMIKAFGGEFDSEKMSAEKAKAFAKQFNAGLEDDGEEGATGKSKSAKHKKGKARAAALKTWRSKKVIEALLAELGWSLQNSDEKDDRWFENRGAVAALLWMRGDLSYPVALPVDPQDDPSGDPKAAMKELARFAEMVEEAAKSYSPPEAEAEAEAGDGEMGEDEGGD